jgi:hypothetical protein
MPSQTPCHVDRFLLATRVGKATHEVTTVDQIQSPTMSKPGTLLLGLLPSCTVISWDWRPTVRIERLRYPEFASQLSWNAKATRHLSAANSRIFECSWTLHELSMPSYSNGPEFLGEKRAQQARGGVLIVVKPLNGERIGLMSLRPRLTQTLSCELLLPPISLMAGSGMSPVLLPGHW